MKISQDLRFNMDKVKQEFKPAVSENAKFYDMIQKQDQKIQAEKMKELLNEINQVGERLAQTRSFKELSKFKVLVKKFVKDASEFGMELKKSPSWNQFGQGKTLSIVETIDEKLVELTDDMLEREGKSIDILSKIGEIKGLLINLYM